MGGGDRWECRGGLGRREKISGNGGCTGYYVGMLRSRLCQASVFILMENRSPIALPADPSSPVLCIRISFLLFC
ncbi:hypothetical protein BJY01DRAFT_206074 [Aspergillus pseudoustus]|uniref:Uncharacterized protein n=1 Tax=Aspergillus pseudoustus TaxID=1810923 RepID=A0ABR4KNN6_9EURO